MIYLHDNLNKLYLTLSEKIDDFQGELNIYNLKLTNVNSQTEYEINLQDTSVNPFKYNVLELYINNTGQTGLTLSDFGEYDYTASFSSSTCEIGRMRYISNISYTNEIDRTITKIIVKNE
jgi:hypothetical protein